MSDSLRKDFSDKAQEKITPDSSKSTYDKVSETVTDTADKAARQVVPDSEKSTTQSLADKTGREKDHGKDQTTTMQDSISNTIGGAAQYASDTLKSASDYVSGTAQDTKASANEELKK